MFTYITQVLPIIFPLKWFYFEIDEYFVLSYFIDVVSVSTFFY